MFIEKIKNKRPGILTYGMTPPKSASEPEKVAEIAQKQIDRLNPLPLDALILYDVQDEAGRVERERPFQYMSTIDPDSYSERYLSALSIPKVIYRCVGNDTEDRFADWVQSDKVRDRFSVYVGASSSKQETQLGLPAAYRLSKQLNPRLSFGGVVIPERHRKKQDEHVRVANKTGQGCSFFVSQAVYDVEASKNFLSDYYYYCTNAGLEMVPILINLAPCGSMKTLDFMKWLGISIPAWLENELKYSHDVLDKSIRLAEKIFEELFEFGMEKGIPIGCSIESVSTRKVEIEASVQLVKDIRTLLDKKWKPAVAR